MSEITLTTLPSRPFVGVRRKLPTSELAGFFAEVLPKVAGWLGANQIQPASMPMAMWCDMDMQTGIADCHAGFFVHEAVAADGDITPGESAAGEALTITHIGPYDTVGQSWMAVYKRAAELGRTPGAGWEIYANDPGNTPAAELRTEIHLPLL